ncbi:MAG: signal peptidase II [Anaerolineae bacterium]|nr:signal peptidase II [Anaerolineae bacterium]
MKGKWWRKFGRMQIIATAGFSLKLAVCVCQQIHKGLRYNHGMDNVSDRTGTWKGLIPYLLVIVVAFMLDRLSKWWAADFFTTHGTTQLHPLLILQETYNRGIALGIWQGIGPLIGWLSIVVVIVLAVMLVRTSADNYLLRTGLAIIIGAALGNMIDRISAGEVLDFLTTPFRSSVFNVADVLIWVGMGFILLGVWRGSRRNRAEQV